MVAVEELELLPATGQSLSGGGGYLGPGTFFESNLVPVLLIAELVSDPASRKKNLRMLAEYVDGKRAYAMAARAQLRASLPGVFYCTFTL